MSMVDSSKVMQESVLEKWRPVDIVHENIEHGECDERGSYKQYAIAVHELQRSLKDRSPGRRLGGRTQRPQHACSVNERVYLEVNA